MTSTETNNEYLEPVVGKLLVKVEEPEKETEAGIILPDSATDLPQRGEIVALSDGWFEAGTFVQTTYRKSDVVMFGAHGGVELEVDSQPFRLLQFKELLGRVKASG